MTLHLVGETIDKRTAHGIYADASDDIEAVILGHAIRIAHYFYPRAYLSPATAVLLARTEDGRVFITGRRNQRARLCALEIVQNETPPQPSTSPAIVGDAIGEIRLDASSLRQRFLEAFRLRSEHASAMTPAMRKQIAECLIEEYGDAKSAANAVFALARDNSWYREGEGEERFLLPKPNGSEPVHNTARMTA